MKNANWIYESVFPENEEMFKKIEAAVFRYILVEFLQRVF